MPTEERLLVEIFKALLSVGTITATDIDVPFEGGVQKGWRIDASVIIDDAHMSALAPYLEIMNER